MTNGTNTDVCPSLMTTALGQATRFAGRRAPAAMIRSRTRRFRASGSTR